MQGNDLRIMLWQKYNIVLGSMSPRHTLIWCICHIMPYWLDLTDVTVKPELE